MRETEELWFLFNKMLAFPQRVNLFQGHSHYDESDWHL